MLPTIQVPNNNNTHNIITDTEKAVVVASNNAITAITDQRKYTHNGLNMIPTIQVPDNNIFNNITNTEKADVVASNIITAITN